MAVLSDVTPCVLIDTDRRFIGAYCHYHQGNDIPEDSHIYTSRRENLKSHTLVFLVTVAHFVSLL
jgi:hypothetical protein